MKTGTDLGTDTAYIGGVHSDVLHLEPDGCPGAKLGSITREVDPAKYPNRRVCLYCDPDYTVEFNHYTNSSCRSCGGNLTHGDCEWCDRYDEVMGGHA